MDATGTFETTPHHRIFLKRGILSLEVDSRIDPCILEKLRPRLVGWKDGKDKIKDITYVPSVSEEDRREEAFHVVSVTLENRIVLIDIRKIAGTSSKNVA